MRIELQQHVPSGFTVHSQSVQEQFFNVRYTLNYVLTLFQVLWTLLYNQALDLRFNEW